MAILELQKITLTCCNKSLKKKLEHHESKRIKEAG